MVLDFATNPAVLDKQVTLLREVVVLDSSGAPQSKWHPYKVVKAGIEPMHGREYWSAAQAQGEATVRIIINFVEGLNNRTRVRYKSLDGTIDYELRSMPINYLERNEFLELMCKELAK